jgi:hypothetical protein
MPRDMVESGQGASFWKTPGPGAFRAAISAHGFWSLFLPEAR